MQYVLRYDAAPGESRALRDWVRDNETALQEHAA